MTPSGPDRPFDFEAERERFESPPPHNSDRASERTGQRGAKGSARGPSDEPAEGPEPEEREERGRRIFEALREAQHQVSPPVPLAERLPPPPRSAPSRAGGADPQVTSRPGRPARGPVEGSRESGREAAMQTPQPTPPQRSRDHGARPVAPASPNPPPAPPARPLSARSSAPGSTLPGGPASPGAPEVPRPSGVESARHGTGTADFDAETRPLPVTPRSPSAPASHLGGGAATVPSRAAAPIPPPRPAGEPGEPAVPRLARVPTTGPLRRTVRFGHLGVGSVFKLALAVYLAVLAAVLVGGAVLWALFGAAGVIGNIEGFFGELLGYEDFEFLGWRILQIFVLIGLVWVVLAAAVTAALAFLYNHASRLVGGLQIRLDEE